MREQMEKTKVRQDYLSKTSGDCLKAIFTIGVLVHHLYQHSGLFRSTLLGAGLQFLGYFSVGMFFFLSGYGLTSSYSTKGQAYISTFPRKRILPFYTMCVFLIIVYTVNNKAMGTPVTNMRVIQSLLFGDTVIGNGWYLQVQLLCYILFYVGFSFCKVRTRAIHLTAALVAVAEFLMIVLGSDFLWYVSTPLFVMGLCFFEYKEKFDLYLSAFSRWIGVLFISVMLLSLTLLCFKFADTKIIQAFCLTISECAFVLCVLAVTYKISINYQLLSKLSRVSLEIYVMQGICLRFFHSKYIYIESPYVYILSVVTGTFALALAVHPVIKSIFFLCGGSRNET